jgi:hypothetical protein
MKNDKKQEMPIELYLPIETKSESNAREHWRNRQRRAKTQRAIATLEMLAHRHKPDPMTTPLAITLTRIAPRPLDDDNLPAALKAIRDGLADALLPQTAGNARRRWAHDNTAAITWHYAQRTGQPHERAVTITITRRKPL